MIPSSMRTFAARSLRFIPVLVLAASGCSTDSVAQITQEASVAHTGGRGGSGGKSKDATPPPATGGTETFDAAAAAKCAVDAAAQQCELCLRTLCCSDFVSCLDDATCSAAFATYRACILKPGQMDQPACLSTFARNGGGSHQALFSCILVGDPGCKVCGGVSVL